VIGWLSAVGAAGVGAAGVAAGAAQAGTLMAGLRPVAVPIKPRITTFPETNLRTYVRRPNGRDGI
jgi:uncharacterized protein YqjF (DUF2071 family)